MSDVMREPGGRILLEAVVLRDGGELLLMLVGSSPRAAGRALVPFFRVGRAVEGAADSVTAAPRLTGGGGYGPIGCWPRVLAAANAWAARMLGPTLRVGADDVAYLGSLEGDSKILRVRVPVWAVMLPYRLADDEDIEIGVESAC